MPVQIRIVTLSGPSLSRQDKNAALIDATVTNGASIVAETKNAVKNDHIEIEMRAP